MKISSINFANCFDMKIHFPVHMSIVDKYCILKIQLIVGMWRMELITNDGKEMVMDNDDFECLLPTGWAALLLDPDGGLP